MSESEMPAFAEQYGPLVKEVFRVHVDGERVAGADLVQRARDYAARGKPDFVLAYLVVADLSEAEKRELLAQAFELRAANTEQQATDWDQEHHRPFPLLAIEARKDRTMARQVRQGKMIRLYARAPKPLDVQ